MESISNKFSLINIPIKSPIKYIISKNKNNNQSTPGGVDFVILSSSKEINEINSCDFELVDESFLKAQNANKTLYTNKYVFNFEIGHKNYILFPNEGNLFEIKTNKTQELNEAPSLSKGENQILLGNENKDNITKEEKKTRIRNLYQLYCEENNILALFDKSIHNEKDMKEYYLINKNWIGLYKENSNFKNFKEKLSKAQSEEELLRVHFDEISKEIKVLPSNTLKESNFYFQTNQNKFFNIKESKELLSPYEFVLVSEKLFDSFYKGITKENNHKKEDYKYKTIIGDKVLFIQDKKHENIFYAFTKDENNRIELLSFLFKYNNKDKFFYDIKNYIQNKGFENYLIERNINFHKNQNQKLEELLNHNKEKIGEYISYKTIDQNTHDKMKIKSCGLHIKSLYNNILKNNNNIKNMNLAIDINEIKKEENRNNFIDVVVVLKDEFDYLIKQLENIINGLVNNPSNDKFEPKKYVKSIKYMKPNDILQNKEYNFINKNSLMLINDSSEFIDSLPNIYYFMNNNQKFISYPNEKKLYKIEFDNSNNFFKLQEHKLDLGYKEIAEKLKFLYKMETYIENQIKSTPLKNIQNPDIYYLVNKNWMKEFKTFYDYDNIIKNKSNMKNQKFPDNLNNSNYFNTELYNNSNVPINFEIVVKKNFDLILKEINDKNKIQLKLKYEFNIYLGDNKIFMQDNNNKFVYYIYSINNKEYTLDYIIKFNQIDNIKSFISKCEPNDKFENLISKYGIKLSFEDDQNIIDDNYNSIGVLKNINSKQVQGKKDPNHCLGLENIGATCYMNATIQCLCHVPNIKNYFQDKQSVFNDINNKQCELTKEFNKLVNNLWKEKSGNKNYYTPTDFKNCISKMNPLFEGIAANDSKDLIIFLYETMHNEINKKDQFQKINAADELSLFRNDYYSKNSSFLIKTFYFEIQSDMTCKSCGFNKSSYNIANIIIFPLEKIREYKTSRCKDGFAAVTLEDCFVHYQVEELLCGSNQIYCNNCKQMADATTKNILFTSPEVITIILNRGKGLEFDVNFEYPLVLDIDKYVIQKEGNDNNKYELICVLSHYGESSMSGHFIAFCKSPVDDKWYCYNDAIVTQSEDPRQQSSGNLDGIPYVLYYQKVKHKQNSDKITLYFNYGEGKQLFLDVDINMKANDMIKALISKYNLPNNITLFYEKGSTMIEGENIINSYNLANKSIITVVDNNQ